jgi:hypothetical protein
MRRALLLLLLAVPAAAAASTPVAPGHVVVLSEGDVAQWQVPGSYYLLATGVGGPATSTQRSVPEHGAGDIGAFSVFSATEPELRVTQGTLRMLLAEPIGLRSFPNGTHRFDAAGTLAADECRAFAFAPSILLPQPSPWRTNLTAGGDGVRWSSLNADLETEEPAVFSLGSNRTDRGDARILQVCAMGRDARYELEAVITPGAHPDPRDPGAAARAGRRGPRARCAGEDARVTALKQEKTRRAARWSTPRSSCGVPLRARSSGWASASAT